MRAAQALLAGSSLPTAVITSNDRCAVGLLDALVRLGVQVPGSISVVGYDDSMLARLAHVNLTTVSQEARKQAEQAVALAVAAATEAHPGLILAAVEAGVPVFREKPVALHYCRRWRRDGSPKPARIVARAPRRPGGRGPHSMTSANEPSAAD